MTYDTLYGVSWSPDGTQDRLRLCRQHRARDRRQDRQAGAVSRCAQRLGARHRVLDGRLASGFGQPRSLDEADRSRHAAVRRQHHQHHARRAQGRAWLRSIGIRRRTKLVVGGADGMPKIYHMYRPAKVAADRRRLQSDPRVSRRCPAGSTPCEYSPDGRRIVAGSSSDGTGEIRVYNADYGQSGLRNSKASPARFTPPASAPTASKSPPPAFRGKVMLMDAATGKLDQRVRAGAEWRDWGWQGTLYVPEVGRRSKSCRTALQAARTVEKHAALHAQHALGEMTMQRFWRSRPVCSFYRSRPEPRRLPRQSLPPACKIATRSTLSPSTIELAAIASIMRQVLLTATTGRRAKRSM